MTPRRGSLGAIVGFIIICTGGLAAAQESQEKEPSPAAAAKAGTSSPNRDSRIVGLQVLVTLSKYQGEKKVSSMPYTLSLATGQPRVSLRMGGEIPIPTSAPEGAPVMVSFNYRPVGTNIDCWATALDDGRYSVNIGLEDSSVYAEDQEVRGGASRAGGHQPSFNTFKVNETVILKDGGSSQFTSATDKITGQVIKVDVTLTVLK